MNDTNIAAVDGALAVSARPVEGGWDVTVSCADGMHVAWSNAHDGGVDLKLRDVALPAMGSRVKVDGRLVKVTDRKFDEGGHSWVMGDDGIWVSWA